MDHEYHVAWIKGLSEVTMSKPASLFLPLLMMTTKILEAGRVKHLSKIL